MERVVSAPILSPSFRWIPSSTHNDSTAFRERQRARMEAAAKARKVEQSNNVKQITRREAKK